MRASAITGRRMLAVCCLTLIALLAAACGSSGTAVPTKTVTVTIMSAGSPKPAPAASSGPLPCLTTDLRLTVGASNGAAGTIFYPLEFTNASSSTCTMYGYPGVAFVSSPGASQIGAPAGRRPPAAPTLVTLEPGATGARHAGGQRRADRQQLCAQGAGALGAGLPARPVHRAVRTAEPAGLR
jgi:Domain of unknown function (DUF4232)